MRDSLTHKIAILGFGREGKALLNFIKKDPVLKKEELWILDKNPLTIIPRNIRTILGDTYLDNLFNFDIIFRSPGIPYTLPEIQKALKKGVIISSGTQLFFERALGTIIGITGTKGKGTTSTLLYNILKRSKRDVHLAGNIGKPALSILYKLSHASITILELSSFQLHNLPHSPHIAGILGIFPDHQDSHKSFKEYVNAKSHIALHQRPDDNVFFIARNRYSRTIGEKSKAIQFPLVFDSQNPFHKEIENALCIPGVHNKDNALLAASIARSIKCKDKDILISIKKFKGLRHRLEFIRTIRQKRSTLSFYNDSASTNPGTTIAGTHAFHTPIILIAGGKDKNLDYNLWKKEINTRVKNIILYGENRNILHEVLKEKGSHLFIVSNLENAVRKSYELGLLLEGEVTVLFSPGAASFDMFKNYEERGNTFKKIVNVIK